MASDKPQDDRPILPSAVLSEWANHQDPWVHQVAAIVLETSTYLTDKDIDRVCSIALIDKGLLYGPNQPVTALGSHQLSVESAEPLVLVAMSEVSDVNALAENQRIDFDESVTILFGENASGKTGYARVLKRMANARTLEDTIHPSISRTLQGTFTPSALIDFEIGGNSDSIMWRNEVGLPPFDRMAVFDSPAVSLYTDEELGYVYVPAVLEIFSNVAQSIGQCRERFEALSPTADEATRFASSFEPGSTIHTLVRSISSATDGGALTTLASMTAAEAERLKTLELEAAALAVGSHQLLLAEAKRLKMLAGWIRSSYEAAINFDDTDYSAARDRWQRSVAAAETARDAMFSDHTAFGPPDEFWQAFIESGDAYLKQHGYEDYPQGTATCPYCHQVLDTEAWSLLTHYREYLEGSLRDIEAQCAKAVDQAAPQFDSAVIAQARASLEATVDADEYAGWLVAGATFIVAAEVAIESTGNRAEASPTLQPMAAQGLKGLIPVIDQLELSITDFGMLVEDQGDKAAKPQAELLSLRERRILATLLPQILEQVDTSERIDAINELIAQTSAAKGSLSTTSKKVSEELQNRSFGELFAEECAALQAPDVTLQHRVRSGEAQRRKSVGRHRPSDILSEGEQQVIAIADFLAECRMRSTAAPVIFDDPVNSLDYRRSNRVAKRIVALSASHQVIVFTHNVLFVTQLLALRKKKQDRVAFFEVRNDGNLVGVISSDVDPRFASPEQIAKRITSIIATGQDAQGSVQDDAINTAIDLIRKWLELFVEQRLFCSVIQRYRANVRLGSIDEIRSEGMDDVTALVAEAFNTTSEHIEAHSQGIEQLNARLTITDVENLWDRLQTAKAKYEA